jgi:GNAT superfamily N-acetyltransferase
MSALPEASPAVTFRPAVRDDWPQIAPWIAQTWEWGDYINAYVWMGWSTPKPDTHLIVAEMEGQIAGFARLVKLGEAEWWLEGVRVAPDQRGQGVGKALIAYMIGLFKQVGAGILRFYTGSKNDAMRSVARDLGFVHRMSYTEMSASPEEIDFGSFKVLLPQNQEMVWQHLRNSPMYRANHFVDNEWIAHFLTNERLGEYLASKQIELLGWRNMNRLQGLAIFIKSTPTQDGGNPLVLGYIDAADDTTLHSMLEAVRGIAQQRGHDRVVWKMPLSVGLERSVERTSYTREWEGTLLLFELPLRQPNTLES